MTTRIYSIPKISCGHCVATIKNELQGIDGVDRVAGDPQAKTVSVDWQPPAADDLIKAKLAEIGYPSA